MIKSANVKIYIVKDKSVKKLHKCMCEESKRRTRKMLKMLIKNDIKRLRRNVQCFKRIKYCLGNGLELLSASVVIAVCHDSRVFRTR